jgi:hypothetical protein
MREAIRQALAEEIARKFEQARGPKPPAPKQVAEEERRARTAQYVDILIKVALRQINR